MKPHSILFVRPGALHRADKATLRDAGVRVIESMSPTEAKPFPLSPEFPTLPKEGPSSD